MTKLTKAERDDLIAAGYVPGNMATFPQNVSPVLRAKALAEWEEDNGPKSALDLPTAVDRQNEMVREREDYHPLDHDKNGKPGGSVPKSTGKRVQGRKKVDKPKAS